jgi:hypothetical protein
MSSECPHNNRKFRHFQAPSGRKKAKKCALLDSPEFSEGRGQGFESLRARHSFGARHKFQTIGHMRSAAVPRKLRGAFDGSFIDERL